ncbi:MAG TPA: hypothetical protein VLC10_03790 [Patescibacteria group bacterium]|nr:hypothetical protein [Patescibacteria group bacterium]
MPLKPEDFRNPLFDKQKIVKRRVAARPGVAADDDEEDDFDGEGEPKRRTEEAIEGTTFTDEYVEVGFTYYLGDGMLSVVNTSNQQLFLGTIATPEDFEKALKKADRKQKKLR